MLIEKMMYFALGLLIVGLVALIILPVVWKHAVRLTKRRIEAARPITMAEFRADKNQLRSEFALSTRRLEVNVETLRKRLAERLGDVNQKRSDLGLLKAERDKNLEIVKKLEVREAKLRSKVAELECEVTDPTQQLRMRERDLDTRGGELDALRKAVSSKLPKLTKGSSLALTGDDEPDVERLGTALAIEHKRASFLEEQIKSLVARLETSDRRSAEININAILTESNQVVEKSADRAKQMLADKLVLEAKVEILRKKVISVESTIMADWDGERMEEAFLREKLNDIAASVSRLVYAVDTDTPVEHNDKDSLFDRVQRFADDGKDYDTLPVKPMPNDRSGSVSNRMAVLREIQER
ncbi:MAG: hypothetical protein MO846_09630 [Candidatus Devosia symbiotica]|nr:hypothetical protein [Candidatus Devosia symbiotica]